MRHRNPTVLVWATLALMTLDKFKLVTYIYLNPPFLVHRRIVFFFFSVVDGQGSGYSHCFTLWLTWEISPVKCSLILIPQEAGLRRVRGGGGAVEFNQG